MLCMTKLSLKSMSTGAAVLKLRVLFSWVQLKLQEGVACHTWRAANAHSERQQQMVQRDIVCHPTGGFWDQGLEGMQYLHIGSDISGT